MAKRTCICFISLFLLAGSSAVSQDTVTVPMNIRAGFDLSGPIMQLIGSELTSYGMNASVDINSAFAVTAGIRYSTFETSDYSYDFMSRGTSVVAGTDYNFIKANVSGGRHYAGIGVRYGLSFYSEEAPVIRYNNEWGAGESSVPLSQHTGHFLEITPGVRTQIFQGVTLGWNIYMRMLISAGAGKDLKPVWMPGYGPGTRGITTGAEYYISISIPYKKIKVVIRPKQEQPEEEEGEEGGSTDNRTFPSSSGGRL
ncbi:MAG: DUF6048 family protein [Bacteroidales bacterium]|nr:DUF6048 family protein [Bacteroidales bacterium]